MAFITTDYRRLGRALSDPHREPHFLVNVQQPLRVPVLVAKRANEPAKGEWFWPGSRLYKGEELADAAHRVAAEDFGIDVTLEEQLGVHVHFWDTSDVVGNPSRHTVNVVYRATPVDDVPAIELDDQHTDYRWLTEAEPDLHEYVRLYLDEHDLLE